MAPTDPGIDQNVRGTGGRFVDTLLEQRRRDEEERRRAAPYQPPAILRNAPPPTLWRGFLARLFGRREHA